MSNDPQVAEQDCAVCLQKCHHPTQLPCGHIFCFLCVKGVAIQNKKCAMCRAEIPPDYLDHPVLLEKASPQASSEEVNEGYQWYYEGRNGWWKYDERSNIELENSYNAGSPECTLLLAGAVYRINFQNMVQMRQNDRTRRRRVQRDTPALPAKGIAGIKIDNPTNEAKNESETSNTIDLTSNDNSNDAEPVEIVDSDDGEVSEVTSQDNEVNELVHRTSAINLVDPTRHANEDT
ncbi:E3 ubiquitin-protein ligase rnf146 isoform X2 [Cydia splendana]|uniref:E3 ubiquitin-protein ligase rnf146 isoform X2 n=1 Tax=Cydia splendana TaxID=1100963 RepID=UPI00212B82DC